MFLFFGTYHINIVMNDQTDLTDLAMESALVPSYTRMDF